MPFFLVGNSKGVEGHFDVYDNRSKVVVGTRATRAEAHILRKAFEAAGGPPRKAIREKLVGVAIIRAGETHHMEKGAHWMLRDRLGDENPQSHKLEDSEGFWTSLGRFVGRDEAQDVALESGQIDYPMDRALLSSDVRW